MTTTPDAAPGARLLSLWQRFSPLPAGPWMFTRMVTWGVPYSGSIGAVVRELRPGYARLEMTERRALQNHLNSVHAVALTNLGEFTSGLSMLCGLPRGVRGIVLGLSTEYLKKARGRLTAICESHPPFVTVTQDFEVVAEIRDAADDVVARVTSRWRLSPTPA